MVDGDVLAIALTMIALALSLYALGFVCTAPSPLSAGKITSIVVYPLKSARGVSVSSAKLDARGLAYDRLWMVVDERGAFMSQRRAPKLALVEVQLPSAPNEPLHVSAPGAQPLSIPVVHAGASRQVRCWDDRCVGIDQGDAAATWFQDYLGVEGVRLVRMPDEEKRYCARKYAPSDSTTAFSDGFPVLLASDASLAEVNARLEARGKPSIPMNRFRPNLVISGSGAFAEDGWSAIQVDCGGAASVSFGVVKPCARCKMPTIDQTTGVPDGRASACATQGTVDDDDEGGGPLAEAEPTATLRTFRSGKALGFVKQGWKADVFFGQNLTVPLSAADSVLTVGDTVVATPRRRRGWFSSGIAGVDY